MIGLLSLFNPAAWAQTLIAGGLCLVIGFGGGFIKGYSAANVAILQQEIAQLRSAASEKERIIDADRKSAELMEIEIEAIRQKIRRTTDETLASPSHCKLSPRELRDLRDISERVGS